MGLEVILELVADSKVPRERMTRMETQREILQEQKSLKVVGG